MQIALTGDSAVTRRVAADPGSAAAALRDTVRSAHASVTNLEVLPTDFRGFPALADGDMCLAADAVVIDELLEYGFDLLPWANNHSLDFGVGGVLGAIAALDARQVPHAGVGLDLAHASLPCYCDGPAGCVAVVACTSSFVAGQQASLPAPGLRPRPGINALRHQRINHLPPAVLDSLRRAQSVLGLDAEANYPITMGLPSPARDPVERLFGSDFVEGDEPRVESRTHPADLERIGRSVAGAATRADAVVVSVHAHEWGGSMRHPPGFLRQFARAMIDQGATAVMGHGPHTLRGMELYRGKPIFYSLGNFFFEYEFVQRLPADTYGVLGASIDEPPSTVMARLRFTDYAEYWQSVLALVTVDDSGVSRIELVPVSLGFGQPAGRRGRPALADPEEAAEILNRFIGLSKELDPAIEILVGSDVAEVRLDACG